MQEFKGSPRSERLSQSERGEDRHGLPSTEDHLSSDSEGKHPLKRLFSAHPHFAKWILF